MCMSVLCLRDGFMFCVTFPARALSYILSIDINSPSPLTWEDVGTNRNETGKFKNEIYICTCSIVKLTTVYGPALCIESLPFYCTYQFENKSPKNITM